MITINYYAVLGCAVLSMVLGFIWYGPIFGKKWMEFYAPKDQTPEEMKKKQKEAIPLYFIQFLISLFQLYVLAWFIGSLDTVSSGAHTAFGIFIAFIATTTLGAGLWNGDSKKVMIQKFLIQAGYQLIFIVGSGFILGMYR